MFGFGKALLHSELSSCTYYAHRYSNEFGIQKIKLCLSVWLKSFQNSLFRLSFFDSISEISCIWHLRNIFLLTYEIVMIWLKQFAHVLFIKRAVSFGN